MAKAGQGGLEALTASLPRENKGPPPVERWNPPFCGDIDMRIATDGTWFYQKTPIGRLALVKLFASVLKREGDKYFLVTPVEKVGIVVDDAPFLAVEMKTSADDGGQVASFPHQCRRLGYGRTRPCAALRAAAGKWRPQAVPACAPRIVGEGDTGFVLRSGGARRRTRGRRQGDVWRCVRRRVLCHGGSERVAGICLMQESVTTGLTASEFFKRARARLTLDVPRGLTDPSVTPTRGDHDADPVMLRSRRCGRSARRPFWCRSSPTPTDGAAHAARAAFAGPCRPGIVPRRQDRQRRRDPCG